MKREHIIGASVSDTTAETAIEAVTVSANSRNRRPMMPPISSSGMNTAISEQADRHHREADLARAFERRLERRLAVLDMAVDVLHHHDGVVDHEADRDGERHQRQVVEAEIAADTSPRTSRASASGTVDARE